MRNVLIADDHEVTRRGVRELLADGFPGVEVAEAADGHTVLARLSERSWDLILLDIMMPGLTILELLQRLRTQNAAVPVLVLTAVDEVEYVVQTMKSGASGLIHKHRAADELLGAIEQVLRGESYLHPETAAAIARSLHDRSEPPVHTRLSVRELEIFCSIALGRAIKEIAGDLALSDKTVSTYLARIREKTGLTTHVEIARYAMRHGLVE